MELLGKNYFISVAVTNTLTKSNLVKKRCVWLKVSVSVHYCGEVSVGTEKSHIHVKQSSMLPACLPVTQLAFSTPV